MLQLRVRYDALQLASGRQQFDTHRALLEADRCQGKEGPINCVILAQHL